VNHAKEDFAKPDAKVVNSTYIEGNSLRKEFTTLNFIEFYSIFSLLYLYTIGYNYCQTILLHQFIYTKRNTLYAQN
jgi:hypothetical protein